jgi:mannosyl-3-phosphoglycerate phosphatase
MRLPRYVVVTDVDGCLLDHATCVHEQSAAAIHRLEALGIPIILCSSKTRAELERLQQELGLADPFIAENGGALFIPHEYFPFSPPGAVRRGGYDVVEFGKPRREVVKRLRETADRERVPIATFSEMSVQEVADSCGLSLAEARLAKLREYDEPFRLVSPDDMALRRLRRSLASAGLVCLHGSRHEHVTAGAHKGLAAAMLRRCCLRVRADTVFVGLGDGLDDVELLGAVDRPVVVRGADERTTAKVASLVRGARVTTSRGPAGWAEAVWALLDESSSLDASGHGARFAGSLARRLR